LFDSDHARASTGEDLQERKTRMAKGKPADELIYKRNDYYKVGGGGDWGSSPPSVQPSF